MFKVFIATITVSCLISLSWVGSTHAQSLNDIEPSNYMELFRQFRADFQRTPQTEITTIDESDRPGNVDILEIENFIENLPNTCSNIASRPSSTGATGSFTKILAKFKKIESLNSSASELEQEVARFLSRCFEENDYQNTLIRVSDSISDAKRDPEIQKLLADGSSCNPQAAKYLQTNQEHQTKDYNSLRSYMDSSVNLYNTQNSRYTELKDTVEALGEDNIELGEDSKNIIQRLTFLNTRIKSEQQELDLLYSDLESNYKTLSQQQSIPDKDVRTLISTDSTDIAFSLDQENTWFTFVDHTELFKFYRLLKASNSEVRVIQQKAVTISQKKQSISELFAERLANVMILDLISSRIENNAIRIESFNQEQELIAPRLSQYRDIAEKRRTEDQRLRGELAVFASASETCSNLLLEEFTKASDGLEDLSPDIKLEFERQYKDKFSEREYTESRSIQSIIQKNPEKVGEITKNFSSLLPRFTNCTEGDQLNIQTASQIIEPVTLSGIQSVRVTEANSIDHQNLIAQIEEQYNSTKTSAHVDINQFLSYLENEISRNPDIQATLAQSAEVVATLEKWTQEANTVQHTQKLYQCEQGDWKELSTSTDLSFELGTCKSEKSEPITVTMSTSEGSLAPETTLVSNLKSSVNAKIYGSCSQNQNN